MKLKLNMMELTSFKGVKHKVIKFEGDVINLIAQNGGFKTTVADAFYWVMADSNTALVKNPNVIPLGETECRPYVKLWLELDGKELTVSREQIVKVKNNDGKIETKVSNVYTINDVDKGLRDFTADLKERGVDMDCFLLFSNPNAFMADTSKKGREDMRKFLFEMVENVSDIDVAKEHGLNELSALLENYKLEEISAMNKATIKKINDKNGRNNEVIEATIRGILESKVQVDVNKLNTTKSEYETELKEVKSNIANLRNADNDTLKEIAELEGKLLEIEQKERRLLEEKLAKASEKYRKADEEATDAHRDIINRKCIADDIFADRDGIKDSLENYRNLYKKVQDEVFDESSTRCPSCGRSFADDEIEDMKKQFEKSKSTRLIDYKSKGETFSKQFEKLTTEYDKAMEEYEKANKRWHRLDSKASELKEAMYHVPRVPDLEANSDYVEVKNKIASLREELQKKGDLKLQEYSNRESYLEEMIRQVVGELAVVSRNDELDKRVADLREERKADEVAKAKSEKILSQVETLERTKNESLTMEINKHFNIIQFKLFDFLKNGSYTECLDILIDGKPISSCANGSLIQLSKLDCIAGLQKFFNQYTPVFEDDAALITSNTGERINIDSQLITLVARDGVTELQIERG